MIAVWFSCGAASACALKLTAEKYGLDHVRAINNPVEEEHEDNRRFLDDVAEWVGVEVEDARHSRFPKASADEVWRAERYMSGVAGAPCTKFLKKRARQQWERNNSVDWHVLGFTVDERARHDRFVLTERENVLPVLIDAGMTKDDCGAMIREAGLRLPAIYSHGFPNANCIGCVKSQSPTYWNLVRREFPEVFEQRAALSRELGVKLVKVKGVRIMLDDLDPNAVGRPLKTMPDCGSFCEEDG